MERRSRLSTIGRERGGGGISVILKCWRLLGDGIIRDRRRAAAGFLFSLFLYIVRRLRRSEEVQSVNVAVSHDKIARRQKVFHSAAITAVRDTKGALDVNRRKRKGKSVLVAAQVEIQTEGNARQCCEGFLPFADGDLKEVALILGFVDGDGFLVGIGF